MVGLFLRCLDPRRARHQRGLQPPSGTLSPPAAVISDSAFEEWLQSNEMEMPMFSLSKGQRQQPPNSAASVEGAPASSAVAAASAETSAAEPATSGTVPSAASIRGQSTRASRPLERCHRTRQRRRQRRPAVLLPLLRRRRGRLERSRHQLGPLMTAGRGRSARGICDFIPKGEYRCGDCHLGRAPFRGVRGPARSWHIRGAEGDIATRDQHCLGQVGVFLEE